MKPTHWLFIHKTKEHTTTVIYYNQDSAMKEAESFAKFCAKHYNQELELLPNGFKVGDSEYIVEEHFN